MMCPPTRTILSGGSSSSVYAPNFKVLFAAEEQHLRIGTVIHPDIEQIKTAKKFREKGNSVKTLAQDYLETDLSPAYIHPTAVINLAEKALRNGQTRGAIAVILKGQIEYDAQCRLVQRLEAFSEMLTAAHDAKTEKTAAINK